MNPIKIILVSILLASCGSNASELKHDQQITANDDIQVISAKNLGGIFFYQREVDIKECRFFDLEPYNSATDEVTHLAKADCTDAVAKELGRPMINSYIEPMAWVKMDPEVSYANVYHWCSEVDIRVAVKKAAYDSTAFEGIGFYAKDRLLNREGDTRSFFRKGDSRLVKAGEARLQKSGELVYLFDFAAAGPCEANGSGSAPWGNSMEFKPHVTFSGDIERWEDVSDNHRSYFNKSWDRSGDILQ